MFSLCYDRSRSKTWNRVVAIVGWWANQFIRLFRGVCDNEVLDLGFLACSDVWATMKLSFQFLRLFRGVGGNGVIVSVSPSVQGVGDNGGLVSVCYGVDVALRKSSFAGTTQAAAAAAVAGGTYAPTLLSLLSAAPRQTCVDVAAAVAEAAVGAATWTVVATREHRDALESCELET